VSSLTFNKAVILGATGPIGISLAHVLQESGLPVRVVSRSEEHLKRCFAGTVEEYLTADVFIAKALEWLMGGRKANA
jgi:short-subunit dehydrogenase